MKTIQVAFGAALEKLLAGQAVVCVKTGTSYEPPAARPSAVLVDVGLVVMACAFGDLTNMTELPLLRIPSRSQAQRRP